MEMLSLGLENLGMYEGLKSSSDGIGQESKLH